MKYDYRPRDQTRTRFVLFGKHTLWVLAGLLTLTLVVVARINTGDESSRIVLSGGKTNTPSLAEPSAMLHPRYQGVDSLNRPFNLIADRAAQPDSDTVLLQNVSMDMTLENSAWVALTANTGHYNLPAKQLELDGDVHMYYEGGYEFRTAHASVDVGQGTAHGETPVEGQGKSGLLKADRFTILQHGGIVWFMGNVHVTLYL